MRKVMLFWVALVGALVLFSAPAAASASGHSAAESLNSNGTVPNVLGWDPSSAVAAVQAAGFVAQTGPGWVDCGPQYVQQQSPTGGTSAPLGSTVTLKINKQPGPGQPCP
jgi:beta-lactam-binding protein with PASTA domain